MQIEYVLLANFLINLLVLKTSAILLKEAGRWYFLSAFIGACFAIVTPYFYLNKVGGMICFLSSTIWYVCLSFRFKTFKKFFQIYCVYMISALIYGGAYLMLINLFATESVLLMLVVLILLYCMIRVLFKKIAHKENVGKFCFEIEIENCGKTTRWRAFLDSGNLLYDPLTQSPVCLINLKVFESIFQNISIEDVLKKSEKLKKIKFAHYIAFNTLNRRDKILVFQVDKVKINEKQFEKTTLGLVLKNFNQAFGSDVILHNSFAFGG